MKKLMLEKGFYASQSQSQTQTREGEPINNLKDKQSASGNWANIKSCRLSMK